MRKHLLYQAAGPKIEVPAPRTWHCSPPRLHAVIYLGPSRSGVLESTKTHLAYHIVHCLLLGHASVAAPDQLQGT